MKDMVQFSFALSSRMRSFIELRDALARLESSYVRQDSAFWLHAATDLRSSLLGEDGRRHAITELVALFQDIENYLKKLEQDAPHYKSHIESACEKIAGHVIKIQKELNDACSFLSQDALLNAYLNAQKKHDWLGHKLCMQQSLDTIWKNHDERTLPLHHALVPLNDAVNFINGMLNDFVSWKKCIAQAGVGQISPDRKTSFGLLVLALPEEVVKRGIIPDISGNRLAIRIRFQQWPPGQLPKDVTEDIPYSMMLIPVGY